MPYIEFDCCPIEEDCVQVSSKTDYMPEMKAQAKKMKEMLEKKFSDIPGYFSVARCSHDFGSYLEIRYHFDESEEGYNSSDFVESNYPLTWDDTSEKLFF